MLFTYTVLDNNGSESQGTIDALNEDIAIRSLQQRGLIISSIKSADTAPMFEKGFSLFEKVSNKEVVILSRQIATLFEAQVSALRIFRLLSEESENPLLRKSLIVLREHGESW